MDPDREFGYPTAPRPALEVLDIHDRIVYRGSFNKALFSGLCVGFMVVPAALLASPFGIAHTTARSVGGTEQFAKHLRA